MKLIPLQQSSYMSERTHVQKSPVFAFLVSFGISFVNEIFEQICVVSCVVLDVCNAMVSLTKNVGSTQAVSLTAFSQFFSFLMTSLIFTTNYKI